MKKKRKDDRASELARVRNEIAMGMMMAGIAAYLQCWPLGAAFAEKPKPKKKPKKRKPKKKSNARRSLAKKLGSVGRKMAHVR